MEKKVNNESKNEKDLRELEFLELKKKAKENKPMTLEEQKKLSSYKNRDMIEQVLVVFGLIAGIFIAVLVLDIFTEGSIWGFIFGNNDVINQAKAIGYTGNNTPMAYWYIEYKTGSLDIFEAIFQDVTSSSVFAIILYTVVHTAICVGFGFIFAYAIKDIIGFFKKVFKGSANLVKELAGTAKESIDSNKDEEKVQKTPKNSPSKKLFSKKEKEESNKQELTKQKKRPAERIQKINDLSDTDLDKLLKGEEIESKSVEIDPSDDSAEPERRTESSDINSEEYKTKPLFSEEEK